MKRHQIDTKAVGSELPDHSSILEDVEDYINYDLSREGSDYVPSSEDEDLVNDENIESGKANLSPKGQLISKCPFGVIVWTKIPTKNTQYPIIRNGLIRNSAEILGKFKKRALGESNLRNASKNLRNGQCSDFQS